MKTTAETFRNIVKYALDEGLDPVEVLQDYLEEKDSHLSRAKVQEIVNAHMPEQSIVMPKQVEVQALPESYFRERLMLIAKSPTETVWVVAKDGTIGDWAVYIGWPYELSDYGKAQDDTGWYRRQLTHWPGVLRNGDKVDEVTACALFPEKANQRYRR